MTRKPQFNTSRIEEQLTYIGIKAGVTFPRYCQVKGYEE